MKIKNFNDLATTAPRKFALEIAEAGLRAIDTNRIIRNAVGIDSDAIFVSGVHFPLTKIRRILVVGVGKCSTDAAAALEDVLGDKLAGGVVIDVRNSPPLKKIKAYKGSHPAPSEENIKAAREVVNFLRDLGEEDLVIFIISGGGSTLLCFPESKNCIEEASVLATLTRGGATIQEINTVRKHLSFARGGFLAKYAYPAQVVSLIFSDVPGDDIEFVASGPTVKDSTTVKQAGKILTKYNVLHTCGIERCGLVETPKEDKYFEKVKNFVVASNHLALEAMSVKADELGFRSKIVNAYLEGEARDVGLTILKELRKAEMRSVLLYGGETTVTMKGRGYGGRNLELTLSALREIREGELIMTIASDGHDNGPYAGAICDKITKEVARKIGLDIKKYLKENNAYPFFEKVGNYLVTGDTGSNVSDLVIAIKN